MAGSMYESLKRKLSEPETWKWIAVSAAAVGAVYYISRKFSSQPTSLPSEPHTDLTLSHTEASSRALAVRNVSYRVHLEFDQDKFRGSLLLNFECVSPAQPLWLDFSNLDISSVSLNEVPLETIKWSKGRLTLEGLSDRNEVEVSFEGLYGEGLVRYTDPADKSVWVFANLKNFKAHRLFPCFDQPDIRASFELSVEGPENWTFIANEPITESEGLRPGRTTHLFKKAASISPHLISFAGGNFATERIVSNKTNIQLGFHCRASLDRGLEENKLKYFALGIQGLLKVQELLGMTYPFTKYDIVFVPGLNAPVESPGCVLLSEDLILKEAPDAIQVKLLSRAVLNSIAAQWFGGLVSMKWWSDMWLFESLARDIAQRAEAKITEDKAEDWPLTKSLLSLSKLTDTRDVEKFYSDVKEGMGHAEFSSIAHSLDDERFIEEVSIFLKDHENSCADAEAFTQQLSEAAKLPESLYVSMSV
mmetsp:Transcript_24168/g.42944  ORF Transcript_24168/g.42944 Transcript_24168/m.42944 type:complete len:476 (-) Transcript_24168:737-2164(-)